MSCQVVTTREGKKAILDETTGEVMHPVVGPTVEAERGYLIPSRLAVRLREASTTPLVVLDVGLGAGSLAIAAWHLSESMSGHARPLTIISFDHTHAALALALDHADDFALAGAAGVAAHQILASGRHDTGRTRWRYVEGLLPGAFEREAASMADIIFWDAFSPRRNPELWTVAAFRAVRQLARPGCTLHTYSGATATRSALLLAGFAVGIGAVTGADKHGTCAALSPAVVDRPLDRRWLERLGRSSTPLPADAPADAMSLVAGSAQFG